MYYSSIGILALILHLIINADSLFGKSKDGNHELRYKYRRFLFVIMIFYISDSFWGFLLDLGIIPLIYADTVIFFLAMGLTVFMWVRYIAVFLNQNKFWTNVLKTIGWVLFGAEAIALVVNYFVPIMFYFTEDGEYVASSARYIILYVQLILFSLIALDTLITAVRIKDRSNKPYFAIGFSGLIMAFFIMLQANYPLMPFYSIGCLIATTIIHSFVVVEARVESSRQLGMVMTVAYKDPLTNVRNVNAYTESKGIIEKDVKNGIITEFAIVVFDLNDLKFVNDTQGHDAGDKYIQDGCRLICRVFKHSPVFRIGGDEFVAFLTNDDYHNRDELFNSFNEQVERNMESGGVIVSAGIGLYDSKKDSGYDDVFLRADECMYLRKKELKKRKQTVGK